MASITGLSNQNYVSSLYNSSKTISGLASGLDTESMIEGLTQSYQAKITQLQQKSTKVEWKQEAYRSMISKMYSFSNKYTSYTSSTNLLSQSFFNSARTSSVSGKYADKVTASGTTTSDVQLMSVDQMATAARYSTSGNFGNVDGQTITGDSVNLKDPLKLSALQGTMSFTYGNKNISIAFSESDIIEQKEGETKAETLARVINEKLADETIAMSDGSSISADKRIKVEAGSDGTISIKAANAGSNGEDAAGNSIYLSGASGSIQDNLLKGMDFSNSTDNKTKKSFEVDESFALTKEENRLAKMSGKSMNVNLNGTIKKIELPKVEWTYDGGYKLNGKQVSNEEIGNEYAKALQESLNKEFGNKITVENKGGEDQLKLEFSLKDKGSELLINTDAGEALGIGNVASNYLSTGKTLEELGFTFDGLTPSKDKDGKEIEGKYDFVINGKTIGSYGKDTTLSTIMSDINSKSDVKVSYSKTSRQFVFTAKETGEHTEVSFGEGLASEMFEKKVDTSAKIKDTLGDDLDGNLAGKTLSVKIGENTYSYELKGESGTLKNLLGKFNKNALSGTGLTASLSKSGSLVIKDKDGKEVNYSFTDDSKNIGASLVKNVQKAQGYTAGQDSKFTVTVNGDKMEMTRSDNRVEIDGLTINFKGKFETKEGEDAVSFQSTIQSDKVVDNVKNMIAELNVMLAEARTGYATMPAQKSTGAGYDPLTDEDMSGMSETAIKNYEEKAKQGLLFADSNLSGLYNGLVSIFNRTGTDRTMMEKMGIGISYDANGAATITLDEGKLKTALEDDFDGVVDIFTRSKENGGGTDGIMQAMKTQLDRYGATTGAVKGILVQQAGTPLASLSLLDNGWQKEIDNYTSQIEKWQEKLESQVDRYTKLFTRLETLTNQMNSQSSALAGLMGG